jgi:hypothetical protein
MCVFAGWPDTIIWMEVVTHATNHKDNRGRLFILVGSFRWPLKVASYTFAILRLYSASASSSRIFAVSSPGTLCDG